MDLYLWVNLVTTFYAFSKVCSKLFGYLYFLPRWETCLNKIYFCLTFQYIVDSKSNKIKNCKFIYPSYFTTSFKHNHKHLKWIWSVDYKLKNSLFSFWNLIFTVGSFSSHFIALVESLLTHLIARKNIWLFSVLRQNWNEGTSKCVVKVIKNEKYLKFLYPIRRYASSTYRRLLFCLTESLFLLLHRKKHT